MLLKCCASKSAWLCRGVEFTAAPIGKKAAYVWASETPTGAGAWADAAGDDAAGSCGASAPLCAGAFVQAGNAPTPSAETASTLARVRRADWAIFLLRRTRHGSAPLNSILTRTTSPIYRRGGTIAGFVERCTSPSSRGAGDWGRPPPAAPRARTDGVGARSHPHGVVWRADSRKRKISSLAKQGQP